MMLNSSSLPWLNTFNLVLKISLRSLWIKKAFWLGALIFALCLLILFPFSLGTQVIQRADVQIGCLWAIVEFVAVVCIGQTFYVEKEGNALEILLCSQSPRSAILLAKISFLSILAFSLTIPILFFWIIFFNVTLINIFNFLGIIILINLFFSVASASLGALIHGLTIRSEAKEILQPILFFPLQTGVLLAASSLSLKEISGNTLNGTWDYSTWWSILILYPVIFISLSCLFSSILLED